jgi:hypothetical protein
MSETQVSLTLFESVFDNKTNKRMDFSSWEKFEALLYSVSKEEGYKPSKGERSKRKPSPLISPAIYKDGTTRANDNVVAWAGWAAVDVDDHEFKGNLENELRSRFGSYYYVCYSTASSTDSSPKFRLVFPLTSSIEQQRIRHFWYALNTELGSIGDIQTKDLSRMYYVPANYPNANNFIFTNTGEYINPHELMQKHKYVEKSQVGMLDKLPPAIRDAIVKERASKLTNTDFHWTSYSNCPFVSRKMIDEYSTISGTGWYHKMYQLMVSIASSAVRQNYPITAKEIAVICRQLDLDTGNWYKNRPLEKEADRALEFVMRNTI